MGERNGNLANFQNVNLAPKLTDEDQKVLAESGKGQVQAQGEALDDGDGQSAEETEETPLGGAGHFLREVGKIGQDLGTY